MLDHLNRFSLDGPEWGHVDILRPTPIEGDIWGDLAPLRGTVWGNLIPVVSGTVMSHAMNGYTTPLMNQIGPHPWGLMKQVPEKHRRCVQYNECLMYQQEKCIPCQSVPECYMPPFLDIEAQHAVNAVVTAWRDGRYVVVVEGDEFI